MYVRNVALHCTGRFTAEERTYIPTSEFGKVFARGAHLCPDLPGRDWRWRSIPRSLLPLMYIGLPSILWQPG